MSKLVTVVGLLLLLVLGVVESFDFNEKDLASEDSLWDLYERWRSYHAVSSSLEEKHMRFDVFKENAKYVHSTNKMDKPYKLGLNRFTDMTNDEFVATHTCHLKNECSSEESHAKKSSKCYGPYCENKSSMQDPRNPDPPIFFDWRDRCAVTKVKDQGKSGNCWVYATVAAVEGYNVIHNGQKLVSLSVQQLVHKLKSKNVMSRIGAFEYIKDIGLLTEADYKKYGLGCNSCKRIKIASYKHLAVNSESMLVKDVYKSPVTVSIAVDRDFQLYEGDLYTKPNKKPSNHVVLIVGYGNNQTDVNEEGIDYWIVKNSWGKEWGENGYMRIQRGVGSKGLLGIASCPLVPH